MKAVNMIDRKRGDDGVNIRLLSSFQKQFPYKIKELYPLRDHVFKIKTSKGSFILKGYSSYNRLKLQETFTSSLHKEGFNNTYSFIILDQDPIMYENKYFGCIQYIEPHKRTFSYISDNERQEGLSLLDNFHEITKQSVGRYQSILPEFNLQKKWLERRDQFVKNTPIISHYISSDLIKEWLNWADWSLEGIIKNEHIIESEPSVILHGDVAHHNFLRGKSGKLYLIDFDLISIGPRSMDLLQYSNRILPFINWNLNSLIRYKSLKDLFRNQSYIYALVYPTDLFREWNRFIRENHFRDVYKLQNLINQTLSKMQLRQEFTKQLQKLVN
ncbi:phosphotransferase [Neobacillus sp. D3-1R]|uniref:phosphotransferase n=1 Tax=Neobacillus sp. D3-1R TaxID=3445778 RepID=UPI003FA052CB